MESIPELIMNNIVNLEDRNGANLGQFFGSFLQQQGVGMEHLYKPPTDIVDDGENFIIYIDIPGINPNNIDVDFYNNKIEIAGERVKPYNDFLKKEIIYGSFKRRLTIPISVTSRDSVSVSALNGVLKITINKTNEERNRFSVRVSENTT